MKSPTWLPTVKCTKMKIWSSAGALLLAVLILPSAAASAAKKVVGWIEQARFPSVGVTLAAKLDTGARTSSLHAAGLRITRTDSGEAASFILGSRSLTLPVVRWVTITRANVPDRRRPVVKLPVCVAGFTKRAEFTLTNRSGLRYQVLIGRRFLQGRMLVDSGRTNQHDETCAEPGRRSRSQ